ncbi:hypothetical protein NQ314_000948 [Rhamnusium bicolor]|uniref:DUF4371 domain-containing protein n=1 Tax=Rhamnusium bicolor TaxID=1586634 RepID=A0AAV8ZVB1_9CUCU|nr:hypothetical protein NQ314_000948 [Rhamnusium bicolor]
MSEKPSISLSAKRAEIKTCAFMVEHNLSFSVMHHFVDLLKDCYPDSKILQEVQLKPTKAKALVKNVIAESQTITLCEKLKNVMFSILIDESTDVSAVQTLCIVVRWLFLLSLFILILFLFLLNCMFFTQILR